MKKMVWMCFGFLMCMTSLAHGGQPLDTLRGSIERCLDIIEDPGYQGDGQGVIQREALWGVIRELFDFTELARRTVGRSWTTFTPDQREEFTEVFAQFLGNMYLDKIDGKHGKEGVIDWSEDMITDSRALVRTKVMTETGEIPVGYRMKKQDNAWKVYDVDIRGMSLVRNYQAQFQQILSKESPDRLIARLREKIKQREEH